MGACCVETSNGSPAVSGGGGFLSRIPLDGDVQGLWDLAWDASIPGSEGPDGTDRSPNGFDLPAVSGTARVGMVGNLTGLLVDDAQYVALSHQAALAITGSVSIEVLMAWDGAGSAGHDIVSFSASGEDEEDNFLYALRNGGLGGLGFTGFWEFDNGDDTFANFELAEPPEGVPHLATMVRDDSTMTAFMYLSGQLIQTVSYADSATGGSLAVLRLFAGNLTGCSVAGVCISNVARSTANVLDRARTVGVVP